MIKVHKGDLLENCEERFTVIVHGCNCFNNMGAGLAAAIKRKFPKAYELDKSTQKGDKRKLGSISVAKIKPGPNPFYVVNAYTQYKYGGGKVNADYKAIRSCMRLINNNFPNCKIGLPMIGCGLAKGDWNKVSKIIEEELTNVEYEVWCL